MPLKTKCDVKPKKDNDINIQGRVSLPTFEEWKSKMEHIEEDIRTQKHYTQFKIQPMEFSGINNLDFLQGNVIKYVCRFRMKNGVEDLKKARHYLDCLIEREEKGTITL